MLLDGTPLRERPIVSTGFSILSPLHWSALALGVFQATAGRGVPVMINSEPLAGATAPVTLAGCLVIGDADTLSGLVINQLLEPGRPCIYNIGFAHVLDMASAIALTGAPENALLQAAGADLARFHGLPSASWMSTEAMSFDAQAAFEKMITGLAHAAAGVNLIWGAGNLESTLAMSPEALVADDEIAGYFLRFQHGHPRGRRVHRPGSHQGGRPPRRLPDRRRTPWSITASVLSRPVLATRTRRSRWEARARAPSRRRRRNGSRAILAAEPKTYLDAHQEAELERIEASGRRQLLGG